ncbi:rhodanese-like domain-containing protein [Deinococcus sp.]|uniref:rhodanese-like domain-containing protein n=1 Tax=Deinococcus sp. TaxID=47478 RepID=UPI0025E86F2B|nr:rhodanese-like domain-containing protein [Deinococcus sp.]
MQEVSPQEAQQRVRSGALLIDVREASEYEEVHAQGARLMPLSEFQVQSASLPRDQEIVLICRSGARSGQATQFLLDQGYVSVANTLGGTLAWQAAGLPTEGAQA